MRGNLVIRCLAVSTDCEMLERAYHAAQMTVASTMSQTASSRASCPLQTRFAHLKWFPQRQSTVSQLCRTRRSHLVRRGQMTAKALGSGMYQSCAWIHLAKDNGFVSMITSNRFMDLRASLCAELNLFLDRSLLSSILWAVPGVERCFGKVHQFTQGRALHEGDQAVPSGALIRTRAFASQKKLTVAT